MWAICDINKIKAHINPRCIKGIKYSDSLTQHGGSSGISKKQRSLRKKAISKKRRSQ